MSNPKQPYNKPPLSIEDQLNRFQERGLAIPDRQEAENYLNYIGYYRLSGYTRVYRNWGCEDQEQYKEGTSFNQVRDLYIFDRLLRNHMMDALERIEIAIKAILSNSIATTNNAFWVTDASFFDYGKHGDILDKLNSSMGHDTNRNQHDFIKHYHQKYNDPHPPSWMIMEVLTFGAISQIYKNLKGAYRIPVAKIFTVQHDVLENWLHILAHLRNVCAHHSRLWNRNFVFRPKIPKKGAKWQDGFTTENQNKLYTYCCIIKHMLGVISPGSTWGDRLDEILKDYRDVDKEVMGFPDDWRSRTIWLT
ncbi:Abi family protein [Terasakiella pusilla]|uniref:Abi family protein n=1 Tax=Terasakiella pusilla TaxID=64973 RepID=UPI003AA88D0F